MRPLLALLLSITLFGARPIRIKPIRIKVVVVTMFERGEDSGDQPGEFQHWVEREGLTKRIPLPSAYRDLRLSGDGVLGICTGIGTARAAASIMALGADSRFDLTRAYWLVAGIAGIDPTARSDPRYGPSMCSTATWRMKSTT